MLVFTKRNILLYFRDKTAIFFSMLAVLILVGLYVFFLGDLTSKGLPDFPSKTALLNAWFLSGILAVASMTTTLGAFGLLVEDRSSKRYMDFYASPIARFKLIGGYIGSALFIGSVMSFFTFIVAEISFVISGEPIIHWQHALFVCGIIILAVTSSGAMVLFIVSFFKTSNAFAAASTVVGTLLGFLAGIYTPIGALPDYLQTIVKLFPVSHSASLFRQVLMEASLVEAFGDAPSRMKEDFVKTMGIQYEINGQLHNKKWSVFYLIGTTIVCTSLSFLTLRRKNM